MYQIIGFHIDRELVFEWASTDGRQHTLCTVSVMTHRVRDNTDHNISKRL